LQLANKDNLNFIFRKNKNMDIKFNKLSKMLGLEILNLDLKKVIDKTSNIS